MRIRIHIAVAALATIAGCGASDYGSPGGTNNNNPGGTVSTSTSINVSNNVFDPTPTKVAAGATVTWTWAAGADTHNVTFTDGQHSPTQNTGSFQRTFTTPGTYSYSCTVHPGMNGQVIVQ